MVSANLDFATNISTPLKLMTIRYLERNYGKECFVCNTTIGGNRCIYSHGCSKYAFGSAQWDELT